MSKQIGGQKIESPCVMACCLNKDDICIGCFRHRDEIAGWSAKSDQEKLIILDNCEQRK